MRLFTKTELKHLKYKLINERGYTAKAADAEIAQLIHINEKAHKLALEDKRKQQQAPDRFQNGFKELIVKNKNKIQTPS